MMVEDRTKEKNSIVILAPTGNLATDEARAEILFVMNNGRLYRTVNDQISVLGFTEYTVRLSLAELFKDVSLGVIKPKEMAWNTLRENVRNQKLEEWVRLKSEKEIQKRITFPVACVVLGFFAVPLACIFEGVNRQFGVVLALATFFVYYALSTVGLNLVESATIAPWVGGWAPNIFFLVGGIFLFHRALNERVPNVRRKVVKIKRKIKKMLPGKWQARLAGGKLG